MVLASKATEVSGGPLTAPSGRASTPITARSAGHRRPACRMPCSTTNAVSSLCAHTAVTPLGDPAGDDCRPHPCRRSRTDPTTTSGRPCFSAATRRTLRASTRRADAAPRRRRRRTPACGARATSGGRPASRRSSGATSPIACSWALPRWICGMPAASTASSAAPLSGNTLVTAIGLRSATASTTLRPSSVSNCSDSTTPWRASAVVSRLPTSSRQFAERDPRHDVQHDTAAADRQVARRQVRPVAEFLGRGVHRGPGLSPKSSGPRRCSAHS